MDSNNLNNTQQPNPYFNTGNPNNGNSNNGYPNNGNPYNNGNNAQPQKAPNIFQQFAFAFVPSQYGRLAKVKTGSMIGFVTLLALIATIIEFVVFSYQLSAFVNSEQVQDVLSKFLIKNGELSLGGREFAFEEGDVSIYLTDEIDTFTDDVTNLQAYGYTTILLAGKKNLVLVNNNDSIIISYRELLGNLTVDKEWIEEQAIPFIRVCVAVGHVFYFIGRIFWYFLCAAVYLLIALVIASVMNKKVSAGALYRTAVYSKVFMFVIVTLIGLLSLANILIPGMLINTFGIVATCVFMGFAINKLPDNC